MIFLGNDEKYAVKKRTGKSRFVFDGFDVYFVLIQI